MSPRKLCLGALLLWWLLAARSTEAQLLTVRTQEDLEKVRARHHAFPLWGLVFDDLVPDSIEQVHLAGESWDPREGALVAVHARTVPELFERNNAKPGERIALSGTKRRRLHAASSAYVPLPNIWDHECAVVLVHWAAEKDLTRAQFASLSENLFPGVAHADVCSRTRKPRERALIERLPVQDHQHLVAFFHQKKVVCFGHAHSSRGMRDAYEECASEKGEWFRKCFLESYA